MSKPTINGKRARYYKLIKDDINDETVDDETVDDNAINDKSVDDNAIDDKSVDDKTVDDNNISFKDKPLNKLFRGKRELYKFYNIKSCPMNYIIKMKTLNEQGKRTRAYWLTNA